MVKRISEETIKKMQELYINGATISEISFKISIPYRTVYCYTRLPERGFKIPEKYQEYLSKKRGFKSRNEYTQELLKKRKKRNANKCLSNLIKEKLKKIKKNQSWLAKQLGATRQTVSLYAQGKLVPRNKGVLKKLSSTLKINYKTLKEILEEN